MVVGQDLQQLQSDKIWVTCESLTKINKNHQNSLKSLLLERSRRGEAGGPNESSRGLGLAPLPTSPQLLEKTVNLENDHGGTFWQILLKRSQLIVKSNQLRREEHPWSGFFVAVTIRATRSSYEIDDNLINIDFEKKQRMCCRQLWRLPFENPTRITSDW